MCFSFLSFRTGCRPGASSSWAHHVPGRVRPLGHDFAVIGKASFPDHRISEEERVLPPYVYIGVRKPPPPNGGRTGGNGLGRCVRLAEGTSAD